MKIIIDTTAKTLTHADQETNYVIDLYSRKAFEILSLQWVKVGWNQKYSHTFSWLGRPIIQMPEDMIRIQEVIYNLKPDVIIETGVAHGGSLIYYASLCHLLKKGRVIGVDIEIRPHNRQAIEKHELYSYITLIEGSSIDPGVVSQVKSQVQAGEVVLVILDSNHSQEHVLAELNSYGELVTPSSYIVATDGIMKDLADVPRGREEWQWNNPYAAAREFLKRNPDFTAEQPAWPFNESELTENITHWPGAWLKRVDKR